MNLQKQSPDNPKFSEYSMIADIRRKIPSLFLIALVSLVIPSTNSNDDKYSSENRYDQLMDKIGSAFTAINNLREKYKGFTKTIEESGISKGALQEDFQKSADEIFTKSNNTEDAGVDSDDENRFLEFVTILDRLSVRRKYDSSELSVIDKAIPYEIMAALEGFEPEIAKEILPKVLINFQQCDVVSGQYLGKGEFDKNGVLFLKTNPSDPRYLVSVPSIGDSDSKLKLATTLVHEIFGHAYDDREGFLSELNNKVLPMHGCEVNAEVMQLRFEAEFIAFYQSCKFLDWVMDNRLANSIEVSYSNIVLPLDNNEKAHLISEELGSFDSDIFIIYKEAINTGNWSKFKKRIATNYLNQMSNFLLPCAIQESGIDGIDDYSNKITKMFEDYDFPPDKPMWRSESKVLGSSTLSDVLENKK